MPYKPYEREYRCFDVKCEKRADGDKELYIVDGYASTYSPYELYRDEKYIWREQIDPLAFNDADMSDVVFLRDHVGQVFARTRNGSLKLSIDEKGLFTSADLGRTSSARSMFEDIQAGLYDRMSFAFKVAEDSYDERTDEDGFRVITRTITKIKRLYDVSAVSFPANPATDIGVSTRSAFDGAIEQLTAERLESEKRNNELARQRLALKMKLLSEESK